MESQQEQANAIRQFIEAFNAEFSGERYEMNLWAEGIIIYNGETAMGGTFMKRFVAFAADHGWTFIIMWSWRDERLQIFVN